MRHVPSPEDRERLDALFERASDLPTTDHAAFLERVCPAGDPLRTELARLLAGLAAEDRVERARGAAYLPPGTHIGPYEICAKLGEGGMGEVYAADQSAPLVRRVALKVIKAGLDTRQVIARFEAERQALARMDHPGIAKVFDAGSTDTGRPYFVMEIIEGVPILAYCEARDLDVRSRLRLFGRVCQAIQHAHQKGVVHRDVKPSNVLVATRDGEPAPKVIDFGIAKAFHDEHRPQLTERRQMIGTPAYMSPEQAGGSGLDVDTRSDVYSLGVLLYELLTGTTPFDERRLAEADLGELLRVIREETPPKPSTRVSTIGRATTGAANDGRSEGRRRSHELRGDLDWIVMKCLEKDRERRYETVDALAEDIERHLRDEPVQAGPPTTSYRVRKFVRRHRGAVLAAGAIAAGAIAAVLIVGAFGTAWGLVRALDERDRADREASRATRAAEDEARARADEAQRARELRAVANFQSRQLGAIDPQAMGVRLRRWLFAQVPEERRALLAEALAGINVTSLALVTLEHDVFRPTLLAIDDQFADQPRVRAQLLESIANTLLDVGLADLAAAPQDQALALWTAERGPDATDTWNALNGVGVIHFTRGRFEEAERCLSAALRGLRRTRGDDDPLTINAMDCHGDLLRAVGRWEDAEALYREALAHRRRSLGNDDPATLESARTLGALLREQHRFDEADPLLTESFESLRRVVGDDDRRTLNALQSLAVLRSAQGRFDDSEQLHRDAVADHRRVLGDEHPATLVAIRNLSTLLQTRGQLREAEPLAREAFEGTMRILGDRHPSTLLATSDFGVLLVRLGQLRDAEPLLRDALRGQRELFGDDHADAVASKNNLGSVLRSLGRPAEAEPFLREALATQRRLHPGDHPNKLAALGNVAGLLKDLGRLDEAEELYREALAGHRRAHGDENPATLTAMDNLGVLLQRRGRLEDAERLIREALAGERRVLGDGHLDTLITLSNLGSVLRARSRPAEAEPLYVEVVQGLRHLGLARNHPYVLSGLHGLGQSLQDQGRHAEAERVLRQAFDGLVQVYPPGHPNTLATGATLALVLLARQRADEALPLLVEALEAFEARADSASRERVLRDWVHVGSEHLPDDWTTPFAKVLLGRDLLRRQAFAEAEALLLAGREGLNARRSSLPAERHALVEEARDHLVALYTAWDRAAPGQGHAERAADWRARD